MNSSTKAPSVPPPSFDPNRAVFEKWFLDYCGTGPQDAVFEQANPMWLERREDGEYDFTRTRDAWTGWQGHYAFAFMQRAALASTEQASADTRGQGSQHVLKAEAARPDATDRETPANASPVGGPMGVGQPAAAGPVGRRRDPRPAFSALLYAVTTASAAADPRATADDRSEAGCAYEVAERAIDKLAGEQASAVSPPALAELWAEVEAMAPVADGTEWIYRYEVLAAIERHQIDQHGGALEQQQGHQSERSETAVEAGEGMCQPNGLAFDAFGEPRVRYVRITFDGTHMVCTPAEADAYMADARANDDPYSYVLADVYLSEREAEDLPEFDGF